MGDKVKKLNPNDPSPLYFQLQEDIKKDIESGVYKVNEMIPTERELQDLYSVSRVTVRKAIEGLVFEGILQKKQGIGTIVCKKRMAENTARLQSFTEKFAEQGLIKSISALEENILIVAATSPDDFLTYTYKLDVSGDNAICITEPQVGIELGNGLSYKNELITNEDGGLTSGTAVTIYENGVEKNKFEVHSRNNFIVGLNIYGLTQSGGYFARIFEFLADGNTAQETFVILDDRGKVISICDGFLKNDDLIRGYNDNTFVLRFEADGITVFPLLELFTTNEDESWFK